jgi:hypothetical protein
LIGVPLALESIPASHFEKHCDGRDDDVEQQSQNEPGREPTDWEGHNGASSKDHANRLRPEQSYGTNRQSEGKQNKAQELLRAHQSVPKAQAAKEEKPNPGKLAEGPGRRSKRDFRPFHGEFF